jgi:predicted nucleic acid-binding protein
MKVFFDTSALVTAIVDQLPNHAAALAECYATLTALPLPRRIQPAEATRLIEENFLVHLEVIPWSVADYKAALTRVTTLGMRSGAIYDALHVRCAERAGCDRIITYNVTDFERLVAPGIEATTP